MVERQSADCEKTGRLIEFADRRLTRLHFISFLVSFLAINVVLWNIEPFEL